VPGQQASIADTILHSPVEPNRLCDARNLFISYPKLTFRGYTYAWPTRSAMAHLKGLSGASDRPKPPVANADNTVLRLVTAAVNAWYQSLRKGV